MSIRAGAALANADLAVANDARGLVLFAHGSGSSRFSRRDRAVAAALQAAGFATLLVDLLTRREEMEDADTGRHRFDIELLASRVTPAGARPGGRLARGSPRSRRCATPASSCAQRWLTPSAAVALSGVA